MLILMAFVSVRDYSGRLGEQMIVHLFVLELLVALHE